MFILDLLGAKNGNGFVILGLDRPLRQREGLCNFPEGLLAETLQPQNLLHLKGQFRQGLKALLPLLTVHICFLWGSLRRENETVQVNAVLGHPVLSGAEEVHDFIGGDSIEPGPEGSFFRVVGMDGLEHSQENVLGQVHGRVHIAGLAIGKGINFPIVGFY